MKKIIFILTLSLIITYLKAQSSNYPNIPYTSLHAIGIENNHIYIVGTCEILKHSKNNGLDWSYISTPSNIKGIHIIPDTESKKTLLFNNKNVFEYDLDEASFTTWVNDDFSNTYGNAVGLFFWNGNIYYATNYMLFQRNDQANWDELINFSLGNDDYAKVIESIGDILYIGSKNGKLLQFELNSNQLTEINDFQNEIRQIKMATKDIGYIQIKGVANPLRTTDGGLTTTLLTAMNENINYIINGPDTIITLNTNRIYVSTDSGASSAYTPMPNIPDMDLAFNAIFDQNGHLIIIGKSGMILKSADLGQSYITLDPLNRSNFLQIQLNESGVGYASGGSSHLLYTDNNGISWTTTSFYNNEQSDLINTLLILDDNSVLIANETSTFIYENETLIQENENGLESAILLPNHTIIGIRKENGIKRIVFTKDKGLNWTNVNVLSNDALSKLKMDASNIIYAPNNIHSLLKSKDYGLTWEQFDINNLPSNISDYAFYKESTGIFSTNNKLYLTTDGGESVQQIASGYGINNIQMLSSIHYIYTSTQNNKTTLKETRDGGNTWKILASYCSKTNWSYLAFDNNLWLAQNGGHINVHKIDINTSVVKTNKPIKPIIIFPNPLNTNGPLYLQTKEIGNLSIYNIEGKIVYHKKNYTNKNPIQLINPKTGIYIVYFQTAEAVYINKLMIE